MEAEELDVFNVQDYLNTEEEVLYYFEAAINENDYNFLLIAINDILNSKGYSRILKKLSKKGIVFPHRREQHSINEIFKAIYILGYNTNITLTPPEE